MKGIYYLDRHGLSINEGSGPVNFHLSWKPSFFVYVYLFGRRFYWPNKGGV